MIKDLKATHFIVGKDNNAQNFKSSSVYGTGCSGMKQREPMTWAS